MGISIFLEYFFKFIYFFFKSYRYFSDVGRFFLLCKNICGVRYVDYFIVQEFMQVCIVFLVLVDVFCGKSGNVYNSVYSFLRFIVMIIKGIVELMF